MKIILSPKRVALCFSLCVLLLVLAHLAQRLIALGTGHHSLLGLVPFFDLRQENNLPTWYSSSSLLFSAALLALIAKARREAGDRDAIYWVVLAIAFTFLSIDEAASLHEKTIRPLRHLVKGHGIFTNTWVLLGGPIAAVFGLAYLKFLFHLPARVRYLLILAGSTYVTGAVGLEAIDGYFQDRYRGGNPLHLLVSTFEEVFEMVGIVIFIYALTSYMSSHVGEIRLILQKNDETTPDRVAPP